MLPASRDGKVVNRPYWSFTVTYRDKRNKEHECYILADWKEMAIIQFKERYYGQYQEIIHVSDGSLVFY